MPRKFIADDPIDKIIFEEDQEVSEMYLLKEGKIGWAMNAYSNKINKSFFKTLRTQKGQQIIGDYYAIHGKKSNFIYIAMEDAIGFGINRFHLQEKVLADFPEIKNNLRMSTLFFYSKII